MSRLTDLAARMATPCPVSPPGRVLATPLFLMHGHGVAEVLIAVTDACFLARCAQAGDWRWLRTGWVGLAFAWWGWMLVCSLINRDGIYAGGAAVPPAAVHRGARVLCPARSRVRRWLWRVIAACAAWIAAQSLLQLATGHNLFGDGRGAAGELHRSVPKGARRAAAVAHPAAGADPPRRRPARPPPRAPHGRRLRAAARRAVHDRAHNQRMPAAPDGVRHGGLRAAAAPAASRSCWRRSSPAARSSPCPR